MRRALLLSAHPRFALRLAARWAAAGDQVTAVLLDDAAALARASHPEAAVVTDALGAGVAIAVHDEALRARGIEHARVVEGIKVVDLDEVADLVADGADRVVWL